jgi:hypothetical protein
MLALATDIAKRVNNVLLRKGYLEQRDELTFLANTEELFSNSNDELQLPAQAASVGNRIALDGPPPRRMQGSRCGVCVWVIGLGPPKMMLKFHRPRARPTEVPLGD